MTAPPSDNPQPIRFHGASGVAKESASELDQILKHSSGGQKLLGKALQIKEGDSGLSTVTFLQDTLVTLIPKWLISRSQVETVESSFLELAESALLYFALPFVGNQVFKPAFTRLFKNEGKTIEEKLKHNTKIQAATILSTFGITLVGGEFTTHYVKNLITAKVFKKDRFSDVVNLSQGQIDPDDHSDVVQKCQTRIKQCLAACVGILGASVLLAAKGPGKFEFLKNATEKTSAKLVKHLNFAEGKNGKLCLGQNQMRLYMGLAIFAYMDSARDKLEQVETATRLALILPYLAFGQSALQNLMLKLKPDYFKPILDADKRVISLSELAKKIKTPNSTYSDAAKDLADPLKRKAVLVGVPLAFGIFGTGIGVGLVNRFWTKYRYQKQQSQTTAPKPASLIPPARINLSSPAFYPATISNKPALNAPTLPYPQPLMPNPLMPFATPTMAYASPYFSNPMNLSRTTGNLPI